MRDDIRFNLAKKYLEGKASPEEIQQLHDYYSSIPLDGEDLVVLTDDKIDTVVFEEMIWHSIEQQISQSKPEAKRFVLARFKKWGIAAGILILILGVSSIWFTDKQPVEYVSIVLQKNEDLPQPGRNVAYLTLADGKSINLELVEDGNPVVDNLVKTTEGVIEIKAKETKVVVWNTLVTPNGGEYKLVLSDGSVVHLNANSSLYFPTEFSDSVRKVVVKGEAFFEIKKDLGKPFVVMIGDAQINVLGTSFNVNSYGDDHYEYISLLEGKIAFQYKEHQIVLKPSQQVKYNLKGDVQVKTVDMMDVLSWRNGIISFQNASVENILNQISRWYDVEIVYEKPAPLFRFEGGIDRNLPITSVLKVLQKNNIQCKLEGNRLIVF